MTNTLFIYWVIMGLKSNMTGVLLREKDRQTDTHADIYTYIHTHTEKKQGGKHHRKMDMKSRIMFPEAKDCWLL